MKFLDLPPLWLSLAIGCLWLETQVTGGVPVGSTGGLIGWALIAVGLLLMVLALGAFVKARTSPIPHTQPSAIITTGIYERTRNPIYLGDALVLLGAAFLFGAASVAIVLPVFVVFIDRRFIRAEERRLAARFPDEWAAYSDRVRRWL